MTQLGGAAILRLVGRLDQVGAPLFTAAIDALLTGDLRVVVVDLLELRALNQAGVTALCTATWRAAHHRIGLRIIADNSPVLDALHTYRAVLDICDLTGGDRA